MGFTSYWAFSARSFISPVFQSPGDNGRSLSAKGPSARGEGGGSISQGGVISQESTYQKGPSRHSLFQNQKNITLVQFRGDFFLKSRISDPLIIVLNLWRQSVDRHGPEIGKFAESRNRWFCPLPWENIQYSI
jgi:hypothetical protein